jgi:hypothetical protein
VRETYSTDGNVISPNWSTVEVHSRSQTKVDHGQAARRSGSAAGDPATALYWRTRSERAKALDGWRNEIGNRFPDKARVLRVAWSLESMFGSAKRYARVTDRYLSRKLNLPIKVVETCIRKLERAGLIVRTFDNIDGKTQRRIWPARANARPATGNCPAICDRGGRS